MEDVLCQGCKTLFPNAAFLGSETRVTRKKDREIEWAHLRFPPSPMGAILRDRIYNKGIRYGCKLLYKT